MTTPLGKPHNCAALGHLTQQVGGVGNPPFSLPTEILDAITGYVTTGETAAADAIRWGRVSASTHLMTHESRINTVITHAKHLDEALIILWNRIASCLVGAPQMNTAGAIRRWMRDPNNAPSLGAIDRVDLVNHRLKVIPPEINTLHNLRTLYLGRNQITQVDPEAFAGCLRLQAVYLEFNQITQIGPQAFAGCPVLDTLNLQHNQITQIAPRAFASCLNLAQLNLEHNQITQVGSEVFVGCQRLRELQLRNNKITHVGPETFAGCPNLQRLWLNNNKIAQIGSKAFAGSSPLHLWLNNNQITHVGPEIFTGCGAQELSLENNRIAQIDPGAFAGCLALHTLNLGHNQIVQIAPQTFAGCGALQTLFLWNNQIVQIAPQTFAGCQGLMNLWLNNNQIVQIDSQAFAGCLILRKLHLGSNLVLWAHDPIENSLETFNRFSNYVCRSELATFYQAVSEGRLSTLEIVERLKQLEDRNLIYEMVYREAKETVEEEGREFSTDGDPQWGEHHVCDDRAIFYLALKRAVREKFARLSPEQQSAVQDRIYEIDRENAAPLSIPSHILLYIDAMAGG